MTRPFLFALLVLAGCVQPRGEASAAPKPAAHLPAKQRWVAVLVAGDGSIPVFDNATGRVAAMLEAGGTPPRDIHRLSANPAALARTRAQVATRARVMDAVAGLRPRAGEACLVFITSHGAHGPGVYLAPRREFLSPADLDAALAAGCGGAPTVAIVSACYTGGFAAPPMAAPNRVVLTAARADRPSFGCDAGRELAFYDACLLQTLSAAPHAWAKVAAGADRCVARMEASEHERPSEPQSAIGAQVAGLAVIGAGRLSGSSAREGRRVPARAG